MDEPKIRCIRTDYYFRNDLVKSNRAIHVNNATKLAFDHMQLNDYSATVCEVYDENDGTLHCVLKNERVRGLLEMKVIFKREIEANE